LNDKQQLIMLPALLLLIPVIFLATYITRAQSTDSQVTPLPDESSSGNTYNVQSGDTLYRISRHTGVSVAALTAYNRLTDPNRIRVGQVLRLPAAVEREAPAEPTHLSPAHDGAYYMVQRGDTLTRIASRFGVPLESLVAANQISRPNLIYAGFVLRIPEGREGQPAEVAEPAAPSMPDGQAVYVVQPGDTVFRVARRLGVAPQALIEANQISNRALIYMGQKLLVPPGGQETASLVEGLTPAGETPTMESFPPATSEGEISFQWPVDSRSIVKFYQVGHKGIDIVTPTGSNVLAAAGGTVLYAGWHNAGYGYMVIIDHGLDRRSLYAHNSRLLASTGQVVARGDLIALSGSTGNSTMPHLHLEIVLANQATDPCSVLPESC
jgi:murein DD-endopeptidase MepM/ murein hydrolase activator NlpD